MIILTLMLFSILLKFNKIRIIKINTIGVVFIISAIMGCSAIAMNWSARSYNNGKMPVREGLDFIDDGLHKRADENTKLRVFIDNYDSKSLGQTFSIGDITTIVGGYIVFVDLGYGFMLNKRNLL